LLCEVHSTRPGFHYCSLQQKVVSAQKNLQLRGLIYHRVNPYTMFLYVSQSFLFLVYTHPVKTWSRVTVTVFLLQIFSRNTFLWAPPGNTDSIILNLTKFLEDTPNPRLTTGVNDVGGKDKQQDVFSYCFYTPLRNINIRCNQADLVLVHY
jgi:hypothetical protein